MVFVGIGMGVRVTIGIGVGVEHTGRFGKSRHHHGIVISELAMFKARRDPKSITMATLIAIFFICNGSPYPPMREGGRPGVTGSSVGESVHPHQYPLQAKSRLRGRIPYLAQVLAL